MKTLDEVINKLEDYPVSPSTLPCSVSIVTVEDLNDALHYLKEYQKIEDEYHELKDWWAEEHTENVPLSWDELNEMEGKPVWIELLGNGHWKGWDVIAGFDEDDFGVAMVTIHNDDYYKADLGKTWQAFRRERK